jgi:DNA polymerase III delta subunit
VAAQPLSPAYLLMGTDRGKVRRAVERLRGRFPADAVELLAAADVEPQDAALACQQQGLFAADRLVVVEGIDAWVKPRRAGRLDPVLAYLADPGPGTVLLLVADAPADPRKPVWPDDDPLLKAVRKAGGKEAVLRFDAPKSAAFARQEAERLGLAFEPEAMARFAELVGDRPDEMSRELEKIATYGPDGPVDLVLVEAMVAARHDDAPWALLDCVTERDRPGAIAELERLFAADAEPHRVLPQLTRHVELVRRTVELGEEGRPSREVLAKELGVAPFRAGKMLAALGAWSARDASRALSRMHAADAALKGMSRMPPALVLERALAEAL